MSDLFLILFNRAMAAGWLVLAVVLLRMLLKKAPRSISCLLWGLVGLRLVWPFSWQSALSLLPSREVLSHEALYDPTPEVHTGIGFVNSAVNGSFTPAMTAAELTSVNPLQVWTWLAGWIWAIGAAVLLRYALLSFLRLKKRVAVSVEEDGLWRCDDIDSPFILGVFLPRIYVPSDLSGPVLAQVVAHERAHLQRKDHWWKPLGWLLLTVFWFHPLLWAAYILLCRDIEVACDEKVIAAMDDGEKKAYSQALVDCAVHHRAVAACPVAFGEVGVKQRVRAVLHYKKPAFWVVVVAVALCVVAAVCFLTDPVEQEVPVLTETDPLADGSVYISTKCVYMTPYSSQLASADSGCYYYIADDYFHIVQRKYQFTTPVRMIQTQWQELPFTEEAWAEKFLLNPVDIFAYEERKYLHLDEVYDLLLLDGELWILCYSGEMLWSIYRLEPVADRVSAQWSYMDGVDADHRPMVIRFDMYFDQLFLNCDQGQLFGVTTNVNYEDKVYYAGQTEVIYWTPRNEDGSTAPDQAEITFEVVTEEKTVAQGVLTINRSGRCGIRVSGEPEGGITVMDADCAVLFVTSLPASGPKAEPGLPEYLLALSPAEIGYVSWAGMNEAPTAEELLPMVQRACKTTVEMEPFATFWSAELYVGERDAGIWNGDDAISLHVGLREPVVHIFGGGNIPGEDVYVADEELYWYLRTMYDTESRGVDQAAYDAYRDWLDPLIYEPEELPEVLHVSSVTKELTGLVLADNSEKLNAKAYGVDIVWNVEPRESAPNLLAGGALVDSEKRIHGMNADSRYLIVVDGEPVGFVGWWFLMGKTLDEQFETKDAFIEAVRNDG